MIRKIEKRLKQIDVNSLDIKELESFTKIVISLRELKRAELSYKMIQNTINTIETKKEKI